jgi:hypothetical protein
LEIAASANCRKFSSSETSTPFRGHGKYGKQRHPIMDLQFA